MSFMYMEPQSRDALESQSKDLLTHFDSHLKIIVDRYLDFFQKRRSIEADYIASLRKLHREATVVDGWFNPRAEPSTRVAWDKIRDCLKGEASTREVFMNSLEIDIIKPLAVLKQNGDEMKRRVEKDLRNSTADYADYAENTISKLQQAYSKKYLPGDHAHSIGPQHGSSKKLKDLFRNRRELDRVESEESVLEDECRKAVRCINIIRSNRAENLEDGYNCLEDLVFRTTVRGVLVKYLDDTITASKTYHDLATDTRPGVRKALDGSDDSDLITSFRRAFSLSVPPATLYRNFRSSGNSNLTFGVPLIDPTSTQYDVPYVIRTCIAEVESRGLNFNKIYSAGSINDAEVLQLRRRFESEKTFSFSTSDDIYSIAALLKLYLWDLPEPLLRLSLRDYKQYGQNKAKYTENDFSLLRSVIRKLHPVHRETLKELSRHLFLVASYSEHNGMTARTLASQFCYAVFRGNTIVQGYVYLKDSLMEDLIQNAHTLFDEPLTPSSIPSAYSRASMISYSSLFEYPDTRLIGPDIASARSSSSIFPSDYSPNLSIPPMLPPNLSLSPLMGLSPSHTLTDVTDSSESEQVTLPAAQSSRAVKAPTTSATNQQLSQRRPYLHMPTPSRSPPISLPSTSTYHPASSATSLQTRSRTFSRTD